MKEQHLLKNRKNDFLKELARELLINENSELDQTISHVCQKLNISEEEVRGFINSLYRRGFLIKYWRGQRYSLTLEGIAFLINLAESCYFTQDLEGEKHGCGKS
jgi:predicted transcriptional regulator